MNITKRSGSFVETNFFALRFAVIVGAFLLMGQTSASAEEPASAAALAQELQNPVANLISVPFQFNYDQNIGVADGDRVTLNIQPVIPVSISDDWNLISRTILPVISQTDTAGNSGDQTGTGDVLQSLFFPPKPQHRMGGFGAQGLSSYSPRPRMN